MNIKELKKRIKDLPDNMEIMVSNLESGKLCDLQIKDILINGVDIDTIEVNVVPDNLSFEQFESLLSDNYISSFYDEERWEEIKKNKNKYLMILTELITL
jgi:hypothetical protein